MHSFYLQKMEDEQDGPANMRPPSSGGRAPRADLMAGDWFLSDQLGLPLPPPLDAATEELNNPFLQEYVSDMFSERPNTVARHMNVSVEDGVSSITGRHHQKIEDEEMNQSSGIRSQMPQASSGVTKPSPIIHSAMVNVNSGAVRSSMSHGCMHMSSPQTSGIKRRKSLAKKVVCVPAPGASSSRPSGEVVPSDFWAWRKYGQKPIKGSPYPRGYYRCSSSKGCSARKQVERSRTDPNMLVITYMSEHNHPWPTRHNALAGSTRSQPSRNSSSASKKSSNNQKPPTMLMEELNESPSSILPSIKVEVQEMVKAMDLAKDTEFEQEFHQGNEYNQSNDFLAEFKELVSDPMNLLFSKRLLVDKPFEEKDNNDLDTCNFFDWEVSSILEK